MRSDNGAYSFYGYHNEGRIWVDGVERTSGSNSSAVNANGDTYICSWTGDIYHNGDGSKVVSVGWSAHSNYAGNSNGDASWSLTKINRYPILNSGKNFKDNENPVFNISGYGVYPIRVRLEAAGASRVSRDLNTKNSIVYTLELTDEERALLRSLMTGESLTVRYVVVGMSGGNEVTWSWKDYTMTRGNRGARLKINGQWKEAIPYVRVNGQWKEAIPYIRVNNQWKEGI